MPPAFHRLPIELVERIYYLATPERRRNLLIADEFVGEAIRNSFTKCSRRIRQCGPTLHGMPDLNLYPHLRFVEVTCNASMVTQFYSRDFVCFQGHTRDLTLVLERNGLDLVLSAVRGVQRVFLNVASSAQLLQATRIVNRCPGLLTADIETAITQMVMPPLRNCTVRGLTLKNLSLPAVEHLDMPNLVALCISQEAGLRRLHLQQLTGLRELLLNCRRFHNNLIFPPALESLTLSSQHESSIAIHQLAALTHLDLRQISSDLDIMTMPELLQLNLHHSKIGVVSPLVLLSEFIDHANVARVVIEQHVTTEFEAREWQDVMDLTHATGFCQPKRVHLTIML